ncbi:MAG: YigZ family protein [Lachnospiraceae bacterium]|nr:YigZ family protein [Lachnospiraceae bacterium]
MPKTYRELYQGGSDEIVIKKSRFIATTCPVKSEEEAAAFIEGLKKKYWNATHNCHAFTIGLHDELTRCSDDGEPSGTAGKPMLDVLLKEGVHNTAVVVTRYFGGTLLGTGGLVRAYTESVQTGLKASIVADKYLCERMVITCDYQLIGKLQYAAAELEIPVESTDYAENVTVNLLVPADKTGAFIKRVTEFSGGKLSPQRGDICYYAVIDGKAKAFEL